MTALQIASAEGHRNVVKLLLKARADVNTSSSLHRTALLAAASRGQVEVARILIQYGADVNAKGGQYGNPLQTAAVVCKTEMARILLDAGASVHARGKALFVCLWTGGADINAPGEILGTALEAAKGTSRFDVFDLLLSYGAPAPDLKVSNPKVQVVQMLSEGVSGDTQRDENVGVDEALENPITFAGPQTSEESLRLDGSQDTASIDTSRPNVANNTSGPPDGRPPPSLSIPGKHHDDARSAWPTPSSSSLDLSNWPLPAPPPLLLNGLPVLTNKSSKTSSRFRDESFKLSHRDYTVACICPMAIELAPVDPTLPTIGARNAYTM
ncbi:uncharacterized protein Z518_01875 [Rhinocladiella mackenziei CBS 650.93]|uniref:protein S-acyltransferase n=1 Tax=Rhinocladiella mackenziei CBS 650.93 TaxID=1442369 RepID=A0A0D2FY47_9EURO|nr:uncharacterized protein Z518_01875 [Rhinocladiella mackenziei CBS 650.93]KIX07222.1 hypothetical protein Z518_01875 [Rhinocladiella mackenziei CBS 650.93]